MLAKEKIGINKEEIKTKESKGRKLSRGMIIKWLPTILALVAALFFYNQWQGLKKERAVVTQDEVEKEVEKIVKKVEKLVLLPEGEMPVLVTVEDKDAITENQKFFEMVENGDKMLIYKEAKKAYLYRPSENKLINVAPISVQGGGGVETTEVVSEVEEEPVKKVFSITVRNGTSKGGLAKDFSLFFGEFDDLEVMSLEDASGDGYENSIIVVGNEEAEELAGKLVERFDLEKKKLPEDEISFESDLLVILGSDKE